MNIEKIHEHSVDTSLLPKGAKILDIGCRGLLFATHFKELKYNVYSIDVEDYAYENWGEDCRYWMGAISDFDGIASIQRNNDAQATRIIKFNPLINESIGVQKLSSYSKNQGIEFWDLIKMDIEGSEYQVIMSLEKAPATQLSIEFHLHTGIYGMYEMTLMEDKLKALGYVAVKHELTSEHGAGENYWDSLWILK